MNRNQVFLHIGTHKTGTTTIQNTLFKHSEELKKEKIIFLGRYKPEITDLSESSNYSSVAFNHLKKSILDDINKYNGFKDHKFIISNEKLSGNKAIGYKNTEFVAKHLRKILKDQDFDTKVIVYFRRQDDFLESLYSQRIYNGSSQSFEQFLNSLDKDSFSWELVANSYAKHFGREKIVVKRYHEEFLPYPNSLIREIGTVLESDFLQSYKTNNTYNNGYTNSALRLIKEVNAHLTQDELRSIKKLLRQGNNKKVFDNYTLLNFSQRQFILNQYKESNSTVAKNFLGLESGDLFPDIEKNIFIEPQEKIDETDILLNFSLAIHHLYQNAEKLDSRVKLLEKKKTFSEKLINKMRKIFRFA